MAKVVKLTESDLNRIIEKVLLEAEEDKPFEKGKFGVRAVSYTHLTLPTKRIV